MRITKVPVKNANVIFKRNLTSGFLKNGLKKYDDTKTIQSFITDNKISSIKLSIQNKILRNEVWLKEEDSEENKEKFRRIYKTVSDFVKNQDWLTSSKNRQIKNDLNTSVEGIKRCIKPRFYRNIGDEYCHEIINLLNGKINESTLFYNWVQSQLSKFQFTADSIAKNKINFELTQVETDSASKKKLFIESALLNLNRFDQYIEDIATQQYKVDAFLTEIQQYYSEQKTDKKADFIHLDLKRLLQKHQSKIFGSKEEPNETNRKSPELYAYHNAISEYFKLYLPIHEKQRKVKRDYNKSHYEHYLKTETLKFTIKSMLLNKVRQQLLLNGKVNVNIHDKSTLSSDDLQALGLVESLRRKISDDITFAAGNLKNTISKDFNDILNSDIITVNKRLKYSTHTDKEKIINFIKKLKGINSAIIQLDYTMIDSFHELLSKNHDVMSTSEKNAYFQKVSSDMEIFNKKAVKELKSFNDKYLSQDIIGGDGFNSILNDSLELDINRSLYSIRNHIFHFQNLRIINYPTHINSCLSDDIKNIKSIFLTRLNTNGVLKYYHIDNLKKIFKTPLNITTNSVAFAPSFRNILKQANNLNKQESIIFKWAEDVIDDNLQIQEEKQYAKFHLLDTVYYHYFLNIFFNDPMLFKMAYNKAFDEGKKRTNKATNDKKFSIYNTFNEIKKEIFYDSSNKKYPANVNKDSIAKFLARIQSEEMNILAKKEKKLIDLNKENKTKNTSENQVFYKRFIRDIFLFGFNYYIKENLNCFIMQNQQSSINESELEKYIAIKSNFGGASNITELSDDSSKKLVWYGLLLLLDQKRLNQLKGDLLKYQQACKTLNLQENEILGVDVNSLNDLIHLRMLYSDRYTNDDDDFSNIISPTLFSIFVDIDPRNQYKDLKSFEPQGVNSESRKQFYLSNGQLITKRAFFKVKKFGLFDLFSDIFHANTKFKVKLDEALRYYELEPNINNTIQERETLHKKWIDEKDQFSEAERYQELIKDEQEYQWLKNKLDLNHVAKLTDLINDIWSYWISIAYLWERDIFYITKSYLDNNGIHYNPPNNESGKVDFVGEIYKLFPREPLFTLLISDFENKKEIRNHLCHYHYFRKQARSQSLLEMLNDVRYLVNHDRKLKNSITKKFIEILFKHGVNIEFKKDTENNHFVLKNCSSRKIIHLGGMKLPNVDNIVTSTMHSDEYIEMVTVLLKFN